MRHYVQRSILKGATRPNHRVVAPTIVCPVAMSVTLNRTFIPTFEFVNAPNVFTLIIEEDSFGRIEQHTIEISSADVSHIKQQIEAVRKVNNGEQLKVFSVETLNAFLTITATSAMYMRIIPLDGADYEQSAHVHLGLFSHPDPRGTVYSSDYNLRSATSVDNITSPLTSYIAPFEDRTSESINRAIDSVANNVENVYLQTNDPYYTDVQIKVDVNIGNNEIIQQVQDPDNSPSLFVPFTEKIDGDNWVRVLNETTVSDNFAKFFSENPRSTMKVKGFITNRPMYVYNPLTKNLHGNVRHIDFTAAYNYSRDHILNNILPNDSESGIGLNPCSAFTRVLTSSGNIVVGGNDGLSSIERTGTIDSVFGEKDKTDFLNPGTFQICSFDVSQNTLDNAITNVLAYAGGKEIDGGEFNSISRSGWVSFPGTLYGTKAMSADFKCLDRGTLRYEDGERLPAYISEGMLVTNGLDAYEIESVTDQKTILLKPINDYSDILLGDTSLIQRTELIPNQVQTFDVYFGKSITKRHIAIFASRPFNIESLIIAARKDDAIFSRRVIDGEAVLDIGVLTRLHNTRVGAHKYEPSETDTSSASSIRSSVEQSIANIDARLALFSKFAQTIIGTGLNFDGEKSQISLESAIDNISSNRSPIKKYGDYVFQPFSFNTELEVDERVVGLPVVLSENYLRRSSGNHTITAKRLINEYSDFTEQLTIRIKTWAGKAFSNIIENGVVYKNTWQKLITDLRSGSLDNTSFSYFRNVFISDQNIFNMPDDVDQGELWFKQLSGMVLMLMLQYGYSSKLPTESVGSFILPTITDVEEDPALAYNHALNQYNVKIRNFGYVKNLGNGVFQIVNPQDDYSSFSIEDIGKRFTLIYIHRNTQNTAIPYIKQTRVILEEWYNASCVKMSAESLLESELAGMYLENCYITYSVSDITPAVSVVEYLNNATTKAVVGANYSNNLTLVKPNNLYGLTSSVSVAGDYTLLENYSTIFVTAIDTYIFLPHLNAFINNGNVLRTLPPTIGTNLLAPLAAMTYDIMSQNSGDPITIGEFEDIVSPIFFVDRPDNDTMVITPKNALGVDKVYVHVKSALPESVGIDALVECYTTCICNDGTIMLKVATSSLFKNTIDRNNYLYKQQTNNLLSNASQNLISFNGNNVPVLQVGKLTQGNSKYFINTLPILRNLLSDEVRYNTVSWFDDLAINITEWRVEAQSTVLITLDEKSNSVLRSVIPSTNYIEQLSNVRTNVTFKPSASSYKSDGILNDKVIIRGNNDATSIRIEHETNAAQSTNKDLFDGVGGNATSKTINSAIEINTFARKTRDSEEPLDPNITNDQQFLDIDTEEKYSQVKNRQSGITVTAHAHEDVVSPGIISVIMNDEDINRDPLNVAIGAVTAISNHPQITTDGNVSEVIRPRSAAIHTQGEVVMDNAVLYVNSDNLASGNARTNWRGTGFNTLGGYATSINTITSARQQDVNVPTQSSNSLTNFTHILSGDKLYRTVDDYPSIGGGKGFSGADIKLDQETKLSNTFSNILNDGISYKDFPNYLGENDILLSGTKLGVFSYNIVDNDLAIIAINISNVSGITPADTGRTASIRIVPAKDSLFENIKTGWGTGVITDILGNDIVISGILVDSLLTFEMIQIYAESAGLTLSSARTALVEQAINDNGGWFSNDAQALAYVIHGREWNVNAHSVNISGGLHISSTNRNSRALSVLLDKERTSVLLKAPKDLSIDVDNNLNIEAASVSGSGIVQLQKVLNEDQPANIGIDTEITLMMMPIRPQLYDSEFNKYGVVGRPQQYLRSGNISVKASIFLLKNTVPSSTLQNNHTNILQFEHASEKAIITHRNILNDIAPESKTNIYNEMSFAVARNDKDMVSITSVLLDFDDVVHNVSKKYFMMDLGDYLSTTDPSISDIKTHLAYTVLTSGVQTQIADDIDMIKTHDEINSYQVGDPAESAVRYNDIKTKHNIGVLRAFSTADGEYSTYEYDMQKPLNISKIEAHLLFDEGEQARLNSFRYSASPTGVNTYSRQHPDTQLVDETDDNLLVSRYNARTYIRPVKIDSEWAYIMEIPVQGMVISLELNTEIIDGFVTPVCDYDLTKPAFEELYRMTRSNAFVGAMEGYNRESINNVIFASSADINGNLAKFTRPLVCWVNFSAYISKTETSYSVSNIQIQPAHFMPTWLARPTTGYDINDVYRTSDNVMNCAAFYYQGIKKLLFLCKEIEAQSTSLDLKPTSLSTGCGSISVSSYRSLPGQNSFFDNLIDDNTLLDAWGGGGNSPAQLQHTADSLLDNFVYIESGENEGNQFGAFNSTALPVNKISMKKKVVRAQGQKSTKKYKFSVVTNSRIALGNFIRVNRAYYQLINSIDLLNKNSYSQLDSVSSATILMPNVQSLYDLWIKEDSSIFQDTSDPIDVLNVLDRYKNIGQAVRKFLFITTDVYRYWRYKNAGMLIDATQNSDAQFMYPTQETEQSDIRNLHSDIEVGENMPKIRHDSRYYGYMMKISVPHIITATRR